MFNNFLSLEKHCWSSLQYKIFFRSTIIIIFTSIDTISNGPKSLTFQRIICYWYYLQVYIIKTKKGIFANLDVTQGLAQCSQWIISPYLSLHIYILQMIDADTFERIKKCKNAPKIPFMQCHDTQVAISCFQNLSRKKFWNQKLNLKPI